MPECHVISVFGPKSGVGKTTLATNFAYALHRRGKAKVLLIDLDTHDCGDIAILHGVSPPKSLADLVPHVHKLTSELLERELYRHGDLISLVPAFRKFRQLSLLTPEKLSQLLHLCREAFDFLVIDCGSDIHSLTVKGFEVSSLILFCTTPKILPLSRSVVSLNEIQSLAFPSDLIQVVINDYDPRGVITETIIRQKLKKDPIALLPPAAKEIEHSIHQGVPLFVSDPRAAYSQVIEELTREIMAGGYLQSMTKRKLRPIALQDKQGQAFPLTAGQEQPYERQLEEDRDRQADLRLKIHGRLIEAMDFHKLTPEELTRQDDRSMEELRAKTREVILRIIDGMSEIASREDRQRLTKEVLDEAIGLGPLEDLLADSGVTEILVNRKDQIYVERSGKLLLTNYRFTTDKHLLGVIERIVAPIGRRIDEKTPMVDARLRDGSRVHAIIPPLAIDGPMITIRKFSKDILGADHLIGLGALTPEISDFLRACVQARLNIIISGGTGTGKTTLLNVLSAFIPPEERILTVEDAAELKLPQMHVGRLESRPPNLQGEGAIPIRELVRNTLRMRPDRIIVGECRGAEALDMLQAMNTGHDGSMTTLHANSPRDCISRLETLVMFAGLDLPSRAIREQISGAIQLIVQLSRLSDGTRRITAITEVTGMEGATVALQDLFLFHQKGVDAKEQVIGVFEGTGLVPKFADRFRIRGVEPPKGLIRGAK